MTQLPATVVEILDAASSRVALTDPVSPGFSGAQLERLTMSDGTVLVLKRSTAEHDLAMAATSDSGRAFLLHSTGAYDRFPEGVDSSVLAVDHVDHEWRMVMRDVSQSLIPEDERVSRANFQRVIRAMTSVHRTFQGDCPDFLCSIEQHLQLFSPMKMHEFASSEHPLPSAALEAWPRFEAAAPARLNAAVAKLHREPSLLAEQLRTHGTTLTHADLAFANIGLRNDAVVMLDFALACQAPSAFDLAISLIQNDWSIDASNDDILDDWRAEVSDPGDDACLYLALLAAVVEYGCWKAPDPAHDSPYSQTFDWWVQAALRGLDTLKI